MKKQIRRAMICTVAMMVAAIVSLTGVTYAWFSESTTAVVDGVKVGVVTKAGGVLMSKVPNPGTNGWSYHVGLGWTGEDFYPASTTPSNLDSNNNLVFYDGVLDDSNLNKVTTTQLPITTNATKGARYFKQDIYFYNPEEKAIPVKLDVTPGNSAIWESIRVGLVNHGTYTINTTTDSEGKVTETVSGITADPNGVAAMIYEFYPFSHHRIGSTDYIDTYGITKEGTILMRDIKDNKGEIIEPGEIDKLEKDGTATSEYIEKVDSYYEFTGHTKNNPEFTIPKNSYYKVTVYIWLEGQDVDCVNEVSGSTFETILNFQRTDIVES